MLRLICAALAFLSLGAIQTAAAAQCHATTTTPLPLEPCMRAATPPQGAPPGLHWFSIKATPASTDTLLDLGLPDAFQLRVMQRNGDAWATVVRLDEFSRFDDRPFRHRRLVAPLSPSRGGAEILIGVRGHGRTPLTSRLLTPEQLHDEDTRADLANGVLFGLMLMLLPLLAIGLGTHHNASYRIYAGLVITSAASIAQIEGYLFQFLWPDAPVWNMRVSELLFTLVVCWHCAFAISLLQMRWRMPRLYRTNLVVLAIGVASLPAQLLFPITDALFAYATAYTLLALLGAWQGVRQNAPAARFYLLGVLALSIGSALASLSVFWRAPFPGLSVLSLPKLSLFGETLFFGAAVLNQLILQNEQRAAQRLQRLAENEQLLRAEETRRAAMAEAEQHKLRLASASHDISQPLASLRYAIAALKAQQDDSQITRHIDNTLSYAQTLLKDMVEQCRLDAAGPEEVDLEQLFMQLEREFAPAAHEKGLKLRVLAPRLRTDGSSLLLYRTLNNLLANAIRYTPKGGVLLGARRRPDGVELQVWDTGPGIAPAMQQALTAPWKQGAPGGEGYGLGLFIVRSLCEQCGYTMRVRSTPGKGTGFSVLLPARSVWGDHLMP